MRAHGLATHLELTLASVERGILNSAVLAETRTAHTDHKTLLAFGLKLAPYLLSISQMDANGGIVASSNPRNLGRRVELAHFLPASSDATAALRIGSPWTGSDFADGEPAVTAVPASAAAAAAAPGIVPVVRDVALASGLRITLLAAVDAAHFRDHYRQSHGDGAAVDLLRSDGTRLLSTQTTPAARANAAANRFSTGLPPGGSARFEQRLPDGKAALTVYQSLPAHPLVIAVHIDREHALASWRAAASHTVIVVGGVLLAALGLALWGTRRLQRVERSRGATLAALQSSEAQHRSTFEKSEVGIAHASADGRFLRCNPHLCRMIGYTEEELARKTISDITYVGDQAEDLALRQSQLAGDTDAYEFEKRYRRKDGSLLWVRVNASVVRNAAGAVDSRVAVIEDVHVRRLARVANQALNTGLTGEAFCRLATRTLATLLGVEFAFVGEPDPKTAHRMRTRALFVDGEFAADFPYDVPGTPCERALDNDLRVYAEGVQQQFPDAAMLVTMGVESYAGISLGVAAGEGAPRSLLVVMSRAPLQHVEAVHALLRMLASRIGAELAREREEKKFRDLLDSSPNAVFMIDGQCVVRMGSRGGEQLFGWEPQALIGRKLGVLFPDKDRAAYETMFMRFLEAAASGPIERGSKDMWGRRNDGSTFPAQVQLRSRDTAAGRVCVAHVQDITERREVEQAMLRHSEELEAEVAVRTAELTRSRDAAEQANRAKSAFLAAMSHELRTPMNGVVGMIDVLEQGNLQATQAEIVRTVRHSAYALLGIVDDVLDFSKIEAGHFQVDREPMDLVAVVEAACDTLNHLAADKGVQLSLFTEPTLPALVLGDATRLRQVLLNLVGNAVKFSSHPGRVGHVAVRALRVDDGCGQAMMEMSVDDDGIGMDESTLARLFTPFTQADSGTTRRYGGTGLGLSISHSLVELMGGAITVRSRRGQGSTFTVRLPLELLPAPHRRKGDAVDLAGLCCALLGGPAGVADDLAVYLEHGGAVVHRLPDAAAARLWLGSPVAGLCVAVVADADAVSDEALAEWRALAASWPNLDARLLVVERDRRRRGVPRDGSPDLLRLDGNALRRAVFLKAVARCAGWVEAALPDEPSLDSESISGPLRQLQAGASGRLILIAEDNESNQKVVLRQLALLDLQADVASDGREALQRWQRGDYRLLLTDLHMPHMDGYELTAAIRAAEDGRRRTAIVALTANALKGEARHCLEIGMDDYMTKPVQLVALGAMVGKWLMREALPAAPPPVRPPAPMPAAAPALDVSVLKALVGDEPEVIDEFLHDFRVGAAKTAQQMREACLARHGAQVQALAHTLKSSARSVGALGLGELCAQLEVAGHAGEYEAVTRLWTRFESEFAAVDRCLEAAQH